MNFIKGFIQKNGNYFFKDESENCKISLGSDLPSALENHIGKTIVIGIRPEHISLCEDDENNFDTDCDLKVIAYENMGNEQLVYLSLASQTLIVRRAPRDTVDIGKQKQLRFLKEKIIYMDEKTGDVIDID
jgi:multiple sugar transport system ATP-binding protein